MNPVSYTSAKLDLEKVVAVLAGAGFQVERFRPVERTVLDTFDGRLHSAGVRLEIRKRARLELVLSGGGPATAQIAVERLPSVAGDLPAGPLRARLAPLLDVRALLPVVTVTVAETVDRNWSGTVDDVDPEFLHDLRVAVRRTRSVLSHGKDVLHPDGRDHFRAEFRWLGATTSVARDLDVYAIEWPRYTAPLGRESSEALVPIIRHIENQQAAEHLVLAEQLRSPRYRGLISGWRAWLEAPGDSEAMAKRSMRPLGGVVAARLSRSQDQLLARGRSIGPDTAAEELHELRKDAKKLRYLLECFSDVFPAAPRKAFVQRLKALQENLGEHQDTEVHAARLQAMSKELDGSPGVTPETFLAIGRLVELFERRRLAARSQFAERFANYDTKRTAQAVDEMLEAAREP
jgi:CHAD domain-containing protein